MQGRNRNLISVYPAHDLDVGSSGYSWHLLNRNANYVKETGCNMSLRPVNMEQCLSYNKEMLRQIIQNHDSMFRYQVQELHRLYRKQKELMNEMRFRKISLRHSMSQTSGSFHSFSHARSDVSQATTSWLTSDSIQQLPKFITSNYFHDGNEVKFTNATIGIDLSANVYLGDQMEHFKEKSHAEALKKLWPATDSITASVKTGDLSSLDLNDEKRFCCLIDLNEPVHIESLPVSPKCLTETDTRGVEINKHNDYGLLDSEGSSDGSRNSPVIIDLNSMPEIEVNLEHIQATKKEPIEAPDKSVVDHHPFVNSKLLKHETDIDLNADTVTKQNLIEFVVNEGLVGPVSPENQECSPPRGESEESIQLEDPSVELDTLAAQSLVLISACKAHACLSWFAEIASVAGDVQSVGALSLENDAPNLSSRVFRKEKETGSLFSAGSRKSHARGKRRNRDSRTEVLTCRSKDVVDAKGGSLDTGPSRRKRGSAKPRKYSKVDKVKKSVGFISKHHPGTEQGVLHSWGKIKKREVGLRRKASVFPVIR